MHSCPLAKKISMLFVGTGYESVNQVPRARTHLLVGGSVGSLLEVWTCIVFIVSPNAPIRMWQPVHIIVSECQMSK